MRKKWKSSLLACIMAASMLMGAASTTAYADEKIGGGIAEETTQLQSEDNQAALIPADEEGKNTAEGASEETTDPTSGANIDPASGADTETRTEASDADLAQAQSTNADWKSKLKDGPYLEYLGHVQTYGDLPAVTDGASFGTTGEGKRLEAFSVWKGNAIQNFSGEIVYRAHVQTYGTLDWKTYGEEMGTRGQGKRLEAIQMYLTDELAQYFDIYYCLHVQTFGWTKWVKGSADDSGWCGTAGLAKRVEAVKVRLVAKEGGTVPEDLHGAMVDYSYLTADSLGSLHYSGHQQTYGDIGPAYAGDYLGVTGESKRLEALSLSLDQGILPGSIKYRAHVQTYGWQDWVWDGELAGTTGEAKRLEAIQISLEGDITKYYDVYYRVHAQTFGWLGWAKNGQEAGTEGLGKRLESLQVVLVPRGSSAPGSTANAFVNRANRGISNVLGISAASVVMHLQSHVNDSFYLGTRYADDIDDGRSPNGDPSFNGYPGMNCTGFVWYVLKSVGADPSSVPNLQDAPLCAGGWLSWQRSHGSRIPTYDFSSKSEMLNSGVLEKGDIIWIWNENEGGKHGYSGTHHVGFFWGDSSDEDCFWHSSPYGGNQISPITGLSNNVSYTVMKL